jgi:hypothetical protein
MSKKSKSLKLVNRRTKEEWLCEDFTNQKNIDGTMFVEVYKSENGRKVWMNVTNLDKKRVDSK